MVHRLSLILFAASLIGFCGVASAELVGTEDAAKAAAPAAPSSSAAERERVRALLERPEVVSQLQALGVSPDDAKARVGAMSDEEVHALAAKIDLLPAGGRLTNNDLLVIIVIILAIVILIIVL